jgi:murein DD-endopeptidase MepM/ murein hydrolase activator NlpD
MNSRYELPRLLKSLGKRLPSRKWLLPVVVLGTMLVALFNWPQIANGAERVADRLVLYIHVASLYTKDPDRKLAMPLAEVETSQIANTWHAPRGANRLHEGQDIFAPQGTPIYSATAGYVLNVGENRLGGQTVSVAGAGGRVYYYAHLDCYARNLREGDYVTTRTILGYVGTTGNAAGTPPHLHFGVYAPSGGAINPLPLLSDRVKPKPVVTKPPTSNKKKKRGHARARSQAGH